MSSFSNAQKLAAVINRWAAPLITSILEQNISSMPFVANIESKIRSTGWVSGQWSVARELQPLMGNLSAIIVEPVLAQYIGNLPDSAVPRVAHGFVDNALKAGQLELMEGKLCFDANDLQLLKRLLNLNLPLADGGEYEVIVEQQNNVL